MALNDLIAQGAQFAPAPDPFRQYAVMQQLQQGEQTNALNRMKMEAEQRGMREQEGMQNFLRSTPNFDPMNPTHQNGLMQAAPTMAPKMLESMLGARKTTGEIENSRLTGVKTRQELAAQGMRNMASDPTDDNVRRSVQAMKDNGIFTEAQAAQSLEHLLKLTPAQRINHWMTQGADPKFIAELTQSKPIKQSDGQREWYVEGNASLPTVGKPIESFAPVQMQVPPGTAASNRISQGNLEVNQGQLRLAEKNAEQKVSKVDAVRADGQKALDDIVSTLGQQYELLDKNNGITSTQNKTGTNVGAYLESSAAGQMLGRALGTENQSARNQVSMTRPHLLMAIKNATGMTAKQLDSNADLKLWLQAATDPTLDVQSNRAALDNILKFASRHAPTGSPPTGAGTMTPQDREALDWANKNPTDPRAAAIKKLHGG